MVGSIPTGAPYSVQMSDDTSSGTPSETSRELADLRRRLQSASAENARLLKLLNVSSQEARLPNSAQTALFERAPGQVDADSAPQAKVAFFAALFGARTDVYAVRWENTRSGRAGWMPAVVGRWRKGSRAADQTYLRLTPEVLTAHLSGDVHIGLYPLLEGDRCCWLAADFDGPEAMLDALAYLKAARAVGAPAALEVSRSGVGAHVWIFFTDPVPAATARQLGTGLIREAIGLRGRMDLGSYDRLFPPKTPWQWVGSEASSRLHYTGRAAVTGPRSSSTWPPWNPTRINGPTSRPWIG